MTGENGCEPDASMAAIALREAMDAIYSETRPVIDGTITDPDPDPPRQHSPALAKILARLRSR